MACEALANAVKHAGAESRSHTRGARERPARVEVIDDGIGGAHLDGGTGLRGIADRAGGARWAPLRARWRHRRDVCRGGDPVRVVIADDSVLLREGLASCSPRPESRSSRRRAMPKAAARGRRARAGRRNRRRAHAADAHRRGRPCGPRAAHESPRSRRAGAVAGRGGGARPRARRRAPGRSSDTC